MTRTLILFFGRLRDVAGACRELDTASLPDTVADLRALLSAGDPSLAQALASPGVRIAVDQEIVADTFCVAAAREIAFLPPMSGG